jgi:DNA-binding NarL/FixJ family response regulator
VADEVNRPTVALLGRRGLVFEVVAQVVLTRGHPLVLLSARESRVEDGDGQALDAREPIGITVLVEPSEEHWQAAHALGAPIIVMLDEATDDQGALDALLAGADAVISACDDREMVERALTIVGAGEVVLPRRVAQLVLAPMRDATRARPSITLTARERQILDSMYEGDAIKQTARKLGISVKTVQNIQSRLFRKLGTHNRAQTITRAHQVGLLTPIAPRSPRLRV